MSGATAIDKKKRDEEKARRAAKREADRLGKTSGKNARGKGKSAPMPMPAPQREETPPVAQEPIPVEPTSGKGKSIDKESIAKKKRELAAERAAERSRQMSGKTTTVHNEDKDKNKPAPAPVAAAAIPQAAPEVLMGPENMLGATDEDRVAAMTGSRSLKSRIRNAPLFLGRLGIRIGTKIKNEAIDTLRHKKLSFAAGLSAGFLGRGAIHLLTLKFGVAAAFVTTPASGLSVPAIATAVLVGMVVGGLVNVAKVGVQTRKANRNGKDREKGWAWKAFKDGLFSGAIGGLTGGLLSGVLSHFDIHPTEWVWNKTKPLATSAWETVSSFFSGAPENVNVDLSKGAVTAASFLPYLSSATNGKLGAPKGIFSRFPSHFLVETAHASTGATPGGVMKGAVSSPLDGGAAAPQHLSGTTKPPLNPAAESAAQTTPSPLPPAESAVAAPPQPLVVPSAFQKLLPQNVFDHLPREIQEAGIALGKKASPEDKFMWIAKAADYLLNKQKKVTLADKKAIGLLWEEAFQIKSHQLQLDTPNGKLAAANSAWCRQNGFLGKKGRAPKIMAFRALLSENTKMGQKIMETVEKLYPGEVSNLRPKMARFKETLGIGPSFG